MRSAECESARAECGVKKGRVLDNGPCVGRLRAKLQFAKPSYHVMSNGLRIRSCRILLRAGWLDLILFAEKGLGNGMSLGIRAYASCDRAEKPQLDRGDRSKVLL
jgi:hypothetical protein